jgi:YspA, cpYpsA-related SLOG family
VVSDVMSIPNIDEKSRILVTGSRTWTDRTVLAQMISDYLDTIGGSVVGAGPFPIIVHGGARGADQLAASMARNWDWIPSRTAPMGPATAAPSTIQCAGALPGRIATVARSLSTAGQGRPAWCAVRRW